jgi:hypothetical protein
MVPKVYFPVNWRSSFCLTSGLRAWCKSHLSRKNGPDSLTNLADYYPNLMNYKECNEIKLTEVSLNLDCYT